jgi:hypothetical protein
MHDLRFKPFHFHIRLCSCRLKVTRRLLLVEQELLTHTEHRSSISVLVGFVLLFGFLCNICISLFGYFALGHCIVSPSLTCGFLLLRLYLQTFLLPITIRFKEAMSTKQFSMSWFNIRLHVHWYYRNRIIFFNYVRGTINMTPTCIYVWDQWYI